MADNKELIWGFLKNEGYPDAQAAAIMGNWYEESHFNPRILQGGGEYDDYPPEHVMNNNVGYGIAQWSYWSRSQGLVDFAAQNGYHSGDLECQLLYFKQEFGEENKQAFIAMGDDIPNLTAWFHNTYEQSNDSPAAIWERVVAAQNTFDELQGTMGSCDFGSASGSSGGVSAAPVTYETKSRVWETAYIVEGDGPEDWKTFYRFNMSSPSFIAQMLTPYAVSAKTGQAGYRLWFNDYSPVPDKNCTVYFKPNNYNSYYDRSLLDNLDRHYVFQTGTGIDSNVIEFNPSCSGILTAVTGGGEVDAVVLDAIKNEIIHSTYNKYKDKFRPTTGDSDEIPEDAITVITASSFSPSELETMASSLWYNTRNIGYDADLVIVGDPELEVQSICTVMVIKNDGLPHYTSGTYLVTKIVDDITAGQFTSTLTLIRNAMDMSVNESGGLDITLSQNTLYVGGNTGMGGDTSSGGSPGAPSADVEAACQWAIDIAEDPAHGYDQNQRMGPDYDCSSLVCHAFEGFGVDPGGSTRTMRQDFIAHGFAWHPELGNSEAGLQRGDILLNESEHTAIYLGDGQIVDANIAENNTIYAGQKGDQTGGEISVRGYYGNSWNGILRYEG